MMAQDSDIALSADSFPARRWRLIVSGFADGPRNMAVDEAILEAVAVGESPPTLRFYGWHPACLSLGYRQPLTAVDIDYCVAAGWDIVRRPTGGRAILHGDELTYSVIAPAGEPRVKGGILESYRRLSEALTVGLVMLGLTSSEAPPDPGTTGLAGPACFDGPSNYEITHEGRKLVGSAQVRKKSVVLQHGALPLRGDVGRVALALRFDSPEEQEQMAINLRRQATTLARALGWDVSFEVAAASLAAGFAQVLNLEMIKGDLSAVEKERAGQLRSQKYAAESWAQRL
ncbi:MAG: lipoate--protein ligase family protein [Chloroflexota bacterium]|nr:MAG: lipoate--protein ligase family protein [Chloroflexota bacterium]